MTFRKISIILACIALCGASAYARKTPKYARVHPLTPEQAALVEEAVGREKVLIKEIQLRTPLVETYIQNTRPDLKLYQVPVSDEYMLNRIDFGKGFFDEPYGSRAAAKTNFFKGSMAALSGLTKALGLDKHFTYNPLGFTEMMFVDPNNFDTQHYAFSFVRKEFLGSVRTWVYDVHPRFQAWAGSSGASGSRTRAVTSSASTAPIPGRGPTMIRATFSISTVGG